MSVYFTGLILAFFIGLIKICIVVSQIFSVRAQNLSKIGHHYNFVSGTFFPIKKPRPIAFISFFVYMLFITPIFSWLSVISSAWGIIAWLTNRTAVPESVKVIQYKIANVNLSKEQMIELQEELSKILGVEVPVVRDDTESEDIEGHNFDHTVFKFDHGRFVVDPIGRTILRHSHSPDYANEYYSVFEYKFEGNLLFVRLLNDWDEHYGKKEWEVKDGVILESEIRARDAERIIHLETVDEKIANLKKQIDWHLHNVAVIRFFVMKNHPELFPSVELRRAIRSEIERLKLAANSLTDNARKFGLSVNETVDGIEFEYPEGFPAEKRDEVGKYFSAEAFEEFGINPSQLCTVKKIQYELLRLIGEKSAA